LSPQDTTSSIPDHRSRADKNKDLAWARELIAHQAPAPVVAPPIAPLRELTLEGLQAVVTAYNLAKGAAEPTVELREVGGLRTLAKVLLAHEGVQVIEIAPVTAAYADMARAIVARGGIPSALADYLRQLLAAGQGLGDARKGTGHAADLPERSVVLEHAKIDTGRLDPSLLKLWGELYATEWKTREQITQRLVQFDQLGGDIPSQSGLIQTVLHVGLLALHSRLSLGMRQRIAGLLAAPRNANLRIVVVQAGTLGENQMARYYDPATKETLIAVDERFYQNTLGTDAVSWGALVVFMERLFHELAHDNVRGDTAYERTEERSVLWSWDLSFWREIQASELQLEVEHFLMSLTEADRAFVSDHDKYGTLKRLATAPPQTVSEGLRVLAARRVGERETTFTAAGTGGLPAPTGGTPNPYQGAVETFMEHDTTVREAVKASGVPDALLNKYAYYRRGSGPAGTTDQVELHAPLKRGNTLIRVPTSSDATAFEEARQRQSAERLGSRPRRSEDEGLAEAPSGSPAAVLEALRNAATATIPAETAHSIQVTEFGSVRKGLLALVGLWGSIPSLERRDGQLMPKYGYLPEVKRKDTETFVPIRLDDPLEKGDVLRVTTYPTLTREQLAISLDRAVGTLQRDLTALGELAGWGLAAQQGTGPSATFTLAEPLRQDPAKATAVLALLSKLPNEGSLRTAPNKDQRTMIGHVVTAIVNPAHANPREVMTALLALCSTFSQFSDLYQLTLVLPQDREIRDKVITAFQVVYRDSHRAEIGTEQALANFLPRVEFTEQAGRLAVRPAPVPAAAPSGTPSTAPGSVPFSPEARQWMRSHAEEQALTGQAPRPLPSAAPLLPGAPRLLAPGLSFVEGVEALQATAVKNPQAMRQGMWGEALLEEVSAANLSPEVARAAANLTQPRWVLIHSSVLARSPIAAVVLDRLQRQLREALSGGESAIKFALVVDGASTVEEAEAIATAIFQAMPEASKQTVSLTRSHFTAVLPAQATPDQLLDVLAGIVPGSQPGCVYGPEAWVKELKGSSARASEVAGILARPGRALGEGLVAAVEAAVTGKGKPPEAVMRRMDLLEEAGMLVPRELNATGEVEPHVKDYEDKILAAQESASKG